MSLSKMRWTILLLRQIRETVCSRIKMLTSGGAVI